MGNGKFQSCIFNFGNRAMTLFTILFVSLMSCILHFIKYFKISPVKT